MRHLLLILIVVMQVGAHAQVAPSIAEMNIELHENQTLPLSNKIKFELKSSNADGVIESLSRWKDIGAKKLDSETLLVSMVEQPTFTLQEFGQYVGNSFVIDLEEESTQHFVSGFSESGDQPFELEQLTAYVSGYIDNPSYIHGFNIASVVATQRSGDCTEYAVLSTALARSKSLPARVIIGTLIVESKNEISAFGHAWSEVWKEGQWHVVDAAMYGSQAIKHFYLPASELKNEGPGFTWSFIEAVNLMPKEIKQLRNASQ